MVNVFKRMRKLKSVRILNVRVGTGAAVFPAPSSATPEFPAITRLHLTYARKIYGGHQGARHFWRNCLPRLKYHNPGIPMTVRQTTDQEGPAALSVYFAQQASKTASMIAAADLKDTHAPAPADNEQVAVLDVKGLAYPEIWSKLKNLTNATEIAATEAEKTELRKLEQMKVKAEHDRVRIATMRQKKKDQERMLQEARGEIEKLKQL
ncbi:mitochondrial 54S ribosomal protein mL61 [Aspergillus saccharolyticus JOP 1030-1]|uniref:50S ribosomal protein Mrp49 n=1 Tax=Aspergillus saccharolyticus JOP 1030-1 TaxID=1450539 RepID=A0A318ZH14_9EURO|nr:50S ribosomal protein Mrp49 [Aspergillus saccharolyticus JOP 1030-1]PYH46846.1 50S ribosomal protein Mrp49 [Aspergillus saccharolyticus JOP 1030-1]